jgi:hypothetical protein
MVDINILILYPKKVSAMHSIIYRKGDMNE